MGDAVWGRINRELTRRKAKHLAPGTWAALGRKIGAKAQVLTNWKTRGVPPKEYDVIATALGWSVDELLGKAELRVQPEEAREVIDLAQPKSRDQRDWPFFIVERERFERLSPQARGYVERAMVDAIKDCEPSSNFQRAVSPTPPKSSSSGTTGRGS